MSESAAASPAHYRLDDLRIEVARQRVERDDGQVLDVAGLSFRLLHYLLMQGTRVVGFDELIAQVWAPALVGEDTVTQRVRLLRQALGDDGRRARYLRVSSLLVDLRGEPGFASVLARIDTAVAADRAQVRKAGGLLPEALTVTAAR